MSDPCPNCGRDDFAKQIYVKEKVDGMFRTFVYCDVCPKKEVQQQFPTFFINKTSENRAEQVKGVMELPDYRKRMEDHVDLQKNRETVMFGYNSPRMKMYRDERVSRSLDGKFGSGNWKKVSDNGFEVVAERK